MAQRVYIVFATRRSFQGPIGYDPAVVSFDRPDPNPKNQL
jgi:hypothetical protein